MINLYLHPNREEDFPKSGGVREHLIQLKKYLARSEVVDLLPYRALPLAHIQHVEATYSPVRFDVPIVYQCHGGFVPHPYPAVVRNIRIAQVIISVAQWLVDTYFHQQAYRTVVIPNGVDVSEFENLPPSGLEPGYVLYGKDWPYYFDDFLKLTARLPKLQFVTTVWPSGQSIPSNVRFIGVQSKQAIKSVIKDAGLLLITGSEVCPTMLLEAWAAKTPVLAKNMDGNRELMQPFLPESSDIIGGMLYKSVPEAASFVQYIMNDRSKLGEQGYQRVVNAYRWEDLLSKYEAVYQSVLEPA